MSRRYGRNQRRKAREQIALQLGEIGRLGHIASEHYQEKLRERTRRLSVEREMVDWAARIIALVGPDSAFAREMSTMGVDAQIFEAVALKGGPFRVDIGDPISRLGPTAEGELINASRMILDLFAVTTLIDKDGLRLRQRFMIQGPDGGVAVVMDMRTLHRLLERGDPGLARHLLESLVKPWMAGKVSR